MAEQRLASVLEWATVAELAGPVYLQRGLLYAEEGRVGPITEREDAIEATVQGEYPYVVRVSLDGSRIVGQCTCPVSETGAFCKHCVALSLAWLGHPAVVLPAAGERDHGRRTARERGADPIGPFLAGLDRAALVDLITSEMKRDAELADRIRLRAAMADPGEDGPAFLKMALDRATRPPGILRYRDVPAFAHRIDEVADLLEQSVRDGRGNVVVDLAERALRRLERALEVADDSDGLIGGLLERFQEIHLDACRASRPDAVKLAERLFHWELEGDWDVFRGAAERYAEVLGEGGLATYRRLAEAEWARIPVLSAGEDDLEHDEDGNRFNVTYMMESLARAFRDVDMEIAVRSRDLSSAYAFLQIAQVCRDAGREGEALSWAERGVTAYPARTDIRLRQFLADEYLRRSRGDDALALIWAELSERPDLEAYERLKHYADELGVWVAWRPRALEEVRRSVEQAVAASTPAPAPRRRWQQPADDGSRLVEILLWEGHVDAAWDEARRLGCGRAIWLKLAHQAEESRPEDALAVYRQEVDALLRVTDKRVYAEAVQLLQRMRALMVRLGKTAEFARYAADVRAANARRPAFLALFDAADLLADRRPSLRVIDGSA